MCKDENEARQLVKSLPQKGKWPYLLTTSDTTGEKIVEEFFTKNEILDSDRFKTIGIIKNDLNNTLEDQLDTFLNSIQKLQEKKSWTKDEITTIFHTILPNFNHKETGVFLDHKM